MNLNKTVVEIIEKNKSNSVNELPLFVKNFLLKKFDNINVTKEQVEFLKQDYYYLGANPTADCLVVKDNCILLIQRIENTVEGGKWAIPGGFIDSEKSKFSKPWIQDKELPLDAALRELSEEANCNLESLRYEAKLVGVFEGNNRDPRDNKLSWSKSHAYLFDISSSNLSTEQLDKIQAMDDAQNVQWFNLNSLPELAFDHKLIIETAQKMYLNNDMTRKIKINY